MQEAAVIVNNITDYINIFLNYLVWSQFNIYNNIGMILINHLELLPYPQM